MRAAGWISVDHEPLRAVARAIVRGTGSDEAEAAEVADHLVEANLKGHDSHGVGMLPLYVRCFRDGHLRPNRHARLISEEGAIGLFSGEKGYGQRVAREVMDWAIARARSNGLALAALRDAQHIGRVGTYGEHAAAAGMISVTFVNAISGPPFVAPFRGSDGRLSTNPVCIVIPGGDPAAPIVLDFATSVVAMGKVRVAYNEGRKMSPGMLIDARGRPTDDPGVLWPDRSKGAILPVGAHKGYGLALICELLAGALTGNKTHQPENSYDCGIKNGMLTIVFDPARLADLGAFHHELAALVEYVKASPAVVSDEPVLVAGEPERLMWARRLAEGIPIDPTTWAGIRAAAEALGIGAARVDELARGGCRVGGGGA